MTTARRAWRAHRRLAHRLTVVAFAALLVTPVAAAEVGPAGAGEASPVVTGRPTATVTPTVLSTGQSFTVQARGFQPGSFVKVTVCSFAAVGSDGCDTAGAAIANVSASGQVALLTSAGHPPQPCPCIVRLGSIDNASGVDVAIELNGVAGPDAASLASQNSQVRGQIVVEDVRLDHDPWWRPWFGVRRDATLTFSVRNSGLTGVENPLLLLALDRDGSGSEPVAALEIGRLAPGESRTYRAPIRLPAFAYGSYRVTGHITGLAQPTDFAASTTTYPLGLLALAIIVLTLVAVVTRRVIRRRQAIEGQPVVEPHSPSVQEPPARS
jgi:hypothetical protein